MEECTLVYNVALQMSFFSTQDDRRLMIAKYQSYAFTCRCTWDTGDSPAAGMLQEGRGGGGIEREERREGGCTLEAGVSAVGSLLLLHKRLLASPL